LYAYKDGYAACIIRQEGKLDVIMIDGQWRNACAAICDAYQMMHGIIVLDNSDRHYQGCDLLRAWLFPDRLRPPQHYQLVCSHDLGVYPCSDKPAQRVFCA